MNTKKYKNGVIEITSSKGMVLTTAIGEDRAFSEIFVLGKYDSVENYEEWTNEAKEKWEKEHPQNEQEE